MLNRGDGTIDRTDYAAGDGAIAVAVGFIDTDGLVDIVVANHLANTVSVLLQNADGTFGPAVSYSVGSRPRGVALANLDGVNGLDVIVANESSDNISILLNDGSGGLTGRVDYASGDAANRVAVADLDGNGALDLVVANRNAHNIAVLLGNGDGTVQPAVTYSTGSNTYPRDVVLADLDGDGKLDAATATYYGLYSLLQGNGDGTFVPSSGARYGGSYYDPYQLVAADLNDDGQLDLAVAGYGQDRLYVMLNRGGSFGNLEDASSYYDSGNPIGVVADDFDGDGRTDLVASNYTSHNVSLLQGNGIKTLGEDPVDSGLYTGQGRGKLWSTSDYDYWSFSGEAGQRLTVAVEVPGNPAASQLYYRIDRPDGDRLTDFYADSYNGWGNPAP